MHFNTCNEARRNNVQIIQRVIVKQLLTEKSREQLAQKFSSQIKQLKHECEQLKFEQLKFEKAKSKKTTMSQQHFSRELEKRQEKIKVLDFQNEQLHMLPLGSEIKETEVQALIEVTVGDKWLGDTKERSIIIKDGVVVDIQ